MVPEAFGNHPGTIGNIPADGGSVPNLTCEESIGTPRDYIPGYDAELRDWLAGFATNPTANPGQAGLTPAEVDFIAEDAVNVTYVVRYQGVRATDLGQQSLEVSVAAGRGSNREAA